MFTGKGEPAWASGPWAYSLLFLLVHKSSVCQVPSTEVVLPFGGPLLASLSLACFSPLSNSFILQGAFLVRVPDWLRYVEVGLLKRLVGRVLHLLAPLVP